MAGLGDAIGSGLKSLGKLIGSAAPLIATALGGPLAGAAVGLVAHAFGADSTDINDVISKVTLDPESQIKLKQLENDHQEMLISMANQSYATEVDDRKSARENSINYRGFIKYMAVFITVGFFAALFILFIPNLVKIDQAQQNMLSMLVGMLVSKWQTIVDFFFGSSSKAHELLNGGKGN